MRTTLLSVLLLLLALTGCNSDTSLKPHDPPPPVYEGIGPQTMVCSHHNCCAIIDGAIVCQGEADEYGLDDAPAGNEWAGLESNPRYLCAWNAMGESTCWGSPVNPLTVPPTNLLVADLRLGTAGGVALLLDGSLELWGSDLFGQLTDTPDLMGPYIAVEAGYGWRCAAADSGDLTCWGISVAEGLDWIEHAQVDAAPSGRGFRGLNRGVGDVLSGIDTEGRAYSWGGGYEFTGPLNDVFAANVAPSDDYVCAQLPSGPLLCSGTLLESFEVGPADSLAQPAAPVADVACGYRHCCAVVEGCFECWGQGQAVQGACSGRE